MLQGRFSRVVGPGTSGSKLALHWRLLVLLEYLKHPIPKSTCKITREAGGWANQLQFFHFFVFWKRLTLLHLPLHGFGAKPSKQSWISIYGNLHQFPICKLNESDNFIAERFGVKIAQILRKGGRFFLPTLLFLGIEVAKLKGTLFHGPFCFLFRSRA